MMIRRLIIAAGLFGGIVAVPAQAEETMKAIAFIPKNHPVMAQSHVWVNKVNDALKGQLKINYIGGPEVVPRYQQIDAVKNGVIDIVFGVFADVQDRRPDTITSVLSKCVLKERETGYYDMMVDSMKKLNIMYIGRVQYAPFYLWTKKHVETLDDLKGLKMRTGSLYDKMMQKLGMIPVTISSRETYTALERGVADGFGWPNIGPRQRGWLKKVKYVIDLPFFHPSNMAAWMNLDRWNKLPADVRKKIIDVTAAYEPGMVAFYQKQADDEWKELDKIVTRVKFSPAENKRYLDAAYNVEWDTLAKKIPADYLARLRKATCN